MHDRGIIPGVVDPWAEEVAHGASVVGDQSPDQVRDRSVLRVEGWRLECPDFNRLSRVRRSMENLEASRHPTLLFSNLFYLSHTLRDRDANIGARVRISDYKVVVEEAAASPGRATEGADTDTLDIRQPLAAWRVAGASAIAGGAAAVGVVLSLMSAVGSDVEVNLYVALSLAIGGIVLLATLVAALRER